MAVINFGLTKLFFFDSCKYEFDDQKSLIIKSQFLLSSLAKFLAGSQPTVIKFFLKLVSKVPSLAPISKTTSFFLKYSILECHDKYLLMLFS